MALYEYRCANCGTTFERRMPMTDVLQFVPCPSCGQQAQKLMGTFVVVGRAEPTEADKPPPWERGEDDDFDFDGEGHSHTHDHGHSHDHGHGHSHDHGHDHVH
ncbi:MAG: zinc ribbon domain-containing protein [Chloroflexota bacterium]|nr:zinc ribbon domain-containing protein [Dehalococcoidia bacterium]MDW8046256.1 zinc ribbon domain-containing protein [Chloroflexota bacterium]